MRTSASLMVLSIALMSYSFLSIAATDEPQQEKAEETYLVIYRPGPRVVGGEIGFRAVSQGARKVHAEPLHKRFHEARRTPH